MERYYQNYARMNAHKSQLEHKNYFTFEQMRDICQLVKDGKWPDGTWSDDECNMWSLLREYFWEE